MNHLLSPSMAELQAGALLVYNDATFSETDFERILKLGSGDKYASGRCSIGRFGLGFCTAFQVTDVCDHLAKALRYMRLTVTLRTMVYVPGANNRV